MMVSKILLSSQSRNRYQFKFQVFLDYKQINQFSSYYLLLQRSFDPSRLSLAQIQRCHFNVFFVRKTSEE